MIHWLSRDAAALAAVLPRCSEVVAVRGEGSWLWDSDDNRYLDFASGIGVTNTGHCHSKVVEAICEQAKTLIHTSVVTHNTLNIQLAERLAALCPFLADPQVFFCNSGAEAVEGSLKLARMVTRKPGVIAFRKGFHGRTFAATCLTTAKQKYRDGYSPLLPYFFHAPYGEQLDSVDRLLDTSRHGTGHKIGAMIVEPILGEGGYIVPPLEWLEGLRERCTAEGILLIFDEVQCGAGRTGNFFAAQTFGVAPDILLFAKGVASGLPLGGIIASKALMDQWPTGSHGSTFGGNPVACAAALATLDILGTCYERVRRFGVEAQKRLKALDIPVQGVGLMIGFDLSTKARAAEVQKRCLDAGLIVLTCGPEDSVIRLIPPLTISHEELTLGLSIIESAMKT